MVLQRIEREGKGLAHFLGFRVIDRPDGEAWFCGEISRRVEMVA